MDDKILRMAKCDTRFFIGYGDEIDFYITLDGDEYPTVMFVKGLPVHFAKSNDSRMELVRNALTLVETYLQDGRAIEYEVDQRTFTKIVNGRLSSFRAIH